MVPDRNRTTLAYYEVFDQHGCREFFLNLFFLIGYNQFAMRKPSLLLVLLSVWPFLAVYGIFVEASDKVPTAREQGRKIYEKYCVECHGQEGHGDGPRAPMLAPRPGNLVSAATSTKSDGELLEIIANGVPRTAMRAWKETLTEEDRLNVLAFIRSLVRFQEPPLTPPPPE